MRQLNLVFSVCIGGALSQNGHRVFRMESDVKRFHGLMETHSLAIMGKLTRLDMDAPAINGGDIVLSTSCKTAFRGSHRRKIYKSLDKITKASIEQADRVAVIGGAELLTTFLPHASRIYLTEFLERPIELGRSDSYKYTYFPIEQLKVNEWNWTKQGQFTDSYQIWDYADKVFRDATELADDIPAEIECRFWQLTRKEACNYA